MNYTEIPTPLPTLTLAVDKLRTWANEMRRTVAVLEQLPEDQIQAGLIKGNRELIADLESAAVEIDDVMAKAARRRELLDAVLLFFRTGVWGDAERAEWLSLIGDDEATSRVLCDAIRAHKEGR